MKTPLLVTAIALAALTLAPTPTRAQDAPAPPATTQPAIAISPDARQLIDQISAVYGKLKSLNLSGTISTATQIEGAAPKTHSTTFTASFVSPNRFRHEAKDDILIGSTGQKLYAFKSDENAYTLADAPKDRVASKDLPKAVAGLLEIQNPSLMLALSKNPADELTEGATDASKTNDTKLDGTAYPTLKLVQKDKSAIKLAIDPQTHLLRQMTLDLTQPLQERRPDLTSAVITVDYTKVAANEPVKDEFAWSPPPGAKDADAMAAAQPTDETQASQLEGKPAPQFKLDSLTGKPVSLADLKGHVVVLDFWATWCGPCRMSLPHLDKLYQSKKANGLQVFAVNQQEDKDDVDQFVKQTGLTVPVLLDTDGKVGNQYGVYGIPQTVVIGKDGIIKKVFIGFPPELPEQLQKAVDSAMSE